MCHSLPCFFMRFSTCYKLVRLSGFFWGQIFLPYNKKWCGWFGRSGTKLTTRRHVWVLGDGIWGRGFIRHRSVRQSRVQNIGFWLLHYTPPTIEFAQPWMWQLAKHIRLKSNKGFRLQASLPTKGQRTRSNSSTVKRVRDGASRLLYEESIGSVLGFFYKKKSNILKKPKSKKISSKDSKKKSVVRSKKKDIWR